MLFYLWHSRSRSFHTKYYKKLLSSNNLTKIKFHDLRHSYTTLLIKDNYSIKAISELLGHSKEIITVDVYCDKSKIICDCLNVLEPYIESVRPETRIENIYNHTDIDLDEIYQRTLNCKQEY